MAELYALCRPNSVLSVKRILLAPAVQNRLDAIFGVMETQFLHGINHVIAFNGEWKPDSDEILEILTLPEAIQAANATQQNAIALQSVDHRNFLSEDIKAVFVAIGAAPNTRILVQYFSPSQIFKPGLTLTSNGNVFTALSEATFSLGSKIDAIINLNGDIRFKSYSIMRRIFDLNPIFVQATNADLNSFCVHASLDVANSANFIQMSDEIIRKSVAKIIGSNVLNIVSVNTIGSTAMSMGFPINIVGGKIVMPTDRKAIKELLSFLQDKVYRGSLGNTLLISNSTRPL